MSPQVTARPDGVVRPLAGDGQAAIIDAASGSLVVLAPGADGQSQVTLFPRAGDDAATVSLPTTATALTGDGDGHAYAATRGGYHRIDLAARTATKVDVEGQPDTEFTAIARRADGRLVLGSADGAVYTLALETPGSDTSVAAQLKIFARVDALVTQGNTAVVLDRGQTSVTTVDASGAEQPSRRCVPVKVPRRWPPTPPAGCWSPTPAATDCWFSARIR